jgi:hypothetical protein
MGLVEHAAVMLYSRVARVVIWYSRACPKDEQITRRLIIKQTARLHHYYSSRMNTRASR